MSRDVIVIGDSMDHKTVIAALANMGANRLTKRHYSDGYGSRNHREKTIGLPPVGPHATDTSIPAVAAAVAKRERKAAKRAVDLYKSMLLNNAHAENGHPQGGLPRNLNPLYIAQ